MLPGGKEREIYKEREHGRTPRGEGERERERA
jgi:hypothetical protein